MTDDERLKDFAQKHRLRIRRDECSDLIIPGRRGQSQLYFAGNELCLMVIDGRRVKRSRWQALGGRLWLGDISEGLQDVKVTGIPLENAKLAIRLAKIKTKRILSEADLAAKRERMAAMRARRSV
jgi:hypothetical protein